MRAKTAALVAIVWVASAVPAAGGLDDALRLLDAGDEAGARASLAASAAEDLYYLALTQRGDERKATLARAAELAPAEPATLRGRIAAQQRLAEGKSADALALLRDTAAREPRNKRLQKELGDLLVRQSDYVNALGAYRAAVAADPAWLPALLALGDAQRAAGDFGGSFNSFNHAVGPDGKPVSALIGRAAARLQLGDADGALGDLGQALQIAEPGSDRGRALMGWFYAQTYLRRLPAGLDRVEQAVAMWRQLGRPDLAAGACNAAGRVQLELGDPDAAVSWYTRGWELIGASSLAPEERTVWQVRELHGLARAAARQRDFAQAQTYADQAKGLMDRDAGRAEEYNWIYPYLIGYIQLERRSYDDAIAQLGRSDLTRPFIQYLMAEAYSRKRDREQARQWYLRALASATALDAESAIVRPLADTWLRKNPAR